MLIKLLTLLLAVAAGLLCFIIDSNNWWLLGLFVVVVGTRFNKKTKDFGRFATMLLMFCAIFLLFTHLNFAFHGILIVLLTGMTALIFIAGPEWGKLYFGAGEIKSHGKYALGVAVISCLMFGLWIYINRGQYVNPVPIALPFDALLIVGFGFAFYIAIVEEIIFRSLMFERARVAAGPAIGIITQGLIYGMMYSAMPIMNELTGITLGAVFGMLLGFLVHKSNSIYLSIFVHFVVSLVTFIELAILGYSAYN